MRERRGSRREHRRRSVDGYLRGVTIAILSGIAVSSVGCRAPANERASSLTFRLDHNRIIVAARLVTPDGAIPVRVWIDTGNPDLWMSEVLLDRLVDRGSGDELAQRSAIVGTDFTLRFGGLDVPVARGTPARASAASSVAPGVPADLNLPASLLRGLAIEVDFPAGRIALGRAGSLTFSGREIPARVDPRNGLVVVPAEHGDRQIFLGVDLGASTSFAAMGLAGTRDPGETGGAIMHHGGVGPTNLWGAPLETEWPVGSPGDILIGGVALPESHYVFLSDETIRGIAERAGHRLDGLIGTSALSSTVVGIDYDGNAVYLDGPRGEPSVPFSAVPVTLRPTEEGSFLVAGTNVEAGPNEERTMRTGDRLLSVDGSTIAGRSMGAVWALLSGGPGDRKRLEIERGGVRLSIVATVVRLPFAVLPAPGG